MSLNRSSFSETICNLISDANELYFERLGNDLLMDKLSVNFNMLHTCMEN